MSLVLIEEVEVVNEVAGRNGRSPVPMTLSVTRGKSFAGYWAKLFIESLF